MEVDGTKLLLYKMLAAGATVTYTSLLQITSISQWLVVPTVSLILSTDPFDLWINWSPVSQHSQLPCLLDDVTMSEADEPLPTPSDDEALRALRQELLADWGVSCSCLLCRRVLQKCRPVECLYILEGR